MGLDEVVRKSELSFDVKSFMQSIEYFEDYNDQMYQIVKGNMVGGSSAHPELQISFILKSGPNWL